VDPRYQGENFNLNMQLVERIKSLAEAKSKSINEVVTPAAFCLAWVLVQGEDVFVIPGTTNSNRFKENLSAGRVLEKFTKDDDRAIREIIAEINVSGPRYSPEFMKAMNMT
jgi:aryl-alcohol dehydrogenase-like predicted oxidoreductase